MSRLSGYWAAYWAARTRRERALLLALAVVLAGVTGWLAIQGLADWREAAGRRAERAAVDHAMVLAGVAMTQRAREQAPAEGLESLVRQSAEERGLEPAMIAPEADGGLTVSFESAASPAVFGWLAGLEAQGARVRAFSALKNTDGGLQVRVTIAPAA